MAKIYEAKEDVERERLAQAAKEARHAQTTGLTWLGVGAALLAFGLLKKKPVPPALPKDAGFIKGLWDGFREGPNLELLGSVGAVLGGLSAFRSGAQAKQAEDQLAKLGPEQIIPPASFKLMENASTEAEGEHVARLQNAVTNGNGSKSL